MKIKGLIILSAFCIGIILIILILTKQSIETDGQPQKETAALEQTMSYSQPLPLAPLSLVRKSTPASPAKSAITIISRPSIGPENEIILPSFTSYEDISPSSTAEENSQPGITKVEKYPTKKESQEMQSKGIVLY